MLTMDVRPFSIVDDPGFLSYSYAMDPHYKVGSRWFYRDLMDKAYDCGLTKIEEKLIRDNPESLSAQLDGWSTHRHGFIGLLVNYITGGWKRVSLTLACTQFDESHTSENLGNWLEQKLERWKVLDKTTVVISDSAANMVHMMDFLPDHMEMNKCLNHLLQLVINDEIFVKPEITNLVKAVRGITNYASNSNLFCSEMRKKDLLNLKML